MSHQSALTSVESLDLNRYSGLWLLTGAQDEHDGGIDGEDVWV